MVGFGVGCGCVGYGIGSILCWLWGREHLYPIILAGLQLMRFIWDPSWTFSGENVSAHDGDWTNPCMDRE